MSDFDISYNLNYGSMARGKQQVDLWGQPSLLNIRRITVSKKNHCFKNNPDIIIIIRAKSRDPSGLKITKQYLNKSIKSSWK